MPSENSQAGAVLVVDDASIIRVACERALTRAGYRVETAENGEAGLKAMEKNPAQVVLCDIRMPGISGVEVLRRLKQKWPGTEVVIMTAYADQDIAEESISLGASEILLKPFDNIAILLQAVNKAMVRAKIHRQGEKIDEQTFEQLLLTSQICSEKELELAKKHARQNNISLRKAITQLNLALDEDLDSAAARFLEIPVVHLQEKILDRDLIKSFPPELARKYLCLPLWKDDSALHLVMTDPLAQEAIAEIEQTIRMKIKPAKGLESEIRTMLDKFLDPELNDLTLEQLVNQMLLAEPRNLHRILALLLERAPLEKVAGAALSPPENGRCRLNLSLDLKLPDKM
jgi:CheY-like chemotaxis protein